MAAAAGANTPPLHGSKRMLLRKSSSASLIDTTGGAGTAAGGTANGATGASSVFPKLNRRSGSLTGIDVQGGTQDQQSKGSEKKKTKRSKTAKAEPKSGWNTPNSTTRTTTLPAIPMSDSTALASSSTRQDLPQISQRPPRERQKRHRRRPGDILLTRAATIDVVVKYQLGQNELKKFKTCFNQIDLDSSGMIDYDEFFEFIDETKTPFSEGLFRMIDADSNGTIDFEEFVHATVLYCMYTRDEILHFAFDTFDPAKTGSIGEKEFKRLISIVNDGKPVFPGNFKSALAEFDRNKDGVLDFEEFKIMNKRYPMLLFPCFRLQDRMQKSTLGENHWLQLHKRLYQRLKLEIYQRKHNGALPALGILGSVKKFFGLDQLDVYEP